jgi:hypothetical protein
VAKDSTKDETKNVPTETQATLLTCIIEVPGPSLGGTPTILTEGFRDIP